MELVSHRLDVRTRQEDEILLMPIGDIQWFGEHATVALGQLRKAVEWGISNNAYFIGMGDYIDSFSPSNRQKLRGAAFYDTALSVIDQKAEQLVKELFDEALAPTVGRWLGMLEGHHFHEFRDGTTSDQMLCKMLGSPFLGSSAYIRLVLSRSTGSGMQDIKIWCHHGAGGGSTVGAPLAKLEKVASQWDGDIFLMGHQHKKVGAPLLYMKPFFPDRGSPKLVEMTRIVACTGSYLKGYTEFSKQGNVPRGGYVEQKMLNPVALGGVVIKIRPRWIDTAQGEVWQPELKVEA